MGVTTTKTNKPFNPRGNDQSPLAYNRAALYSGKALDFDGVNDEVEVSNITDTYKSFVLSFNSDDEITSTTPVQRMFGVYSSYFGVSVGSATGVLTGETLTFLPNGSSRTATTMNFAANTWYHLAVVWNGLNNNFDIYINGQNKTILSLGTTSLSVVNNLKIGQTLATGTPWKGKISGFKGFTESLTPAQIADLYNNPEKIVPTGVDNTALKLWLPMMEGAGTTAYDGSGNGNHGTISGATYVNGVGAPVAQTSVIDWNKGTNLLPHSAELDQFNDVIGVSVLTNQESISGNNDAFLISVNSSFGTHRIVEPLTTTSALHSVSFYAKANGVNKVVIFINGQNQGVIFNLDTATTQSFTKYNAVEATNQTIQDKGNGWYYCGFTIQIGTSATFQIQLYDAATTPDDTWTGDGTSGVYVYGVSFVTADNVKPYVPTFATAQSTPVLLPAGLTTGRDITGVNLFENVRKQGALNLDGSSWSEVHDNASLDFSSGMTLEAWVQLDDADGEQHIMGKWSFGNNIKEYLIYYNHTSNQSQFYFGHGANVSEASIDITATGQYFHLVGTTDGSTITPYVNGVAGTTAVQTTSLAASNIPVTIGMDDVHNTEASAKKQIAQPRIYNRALSAEEIQRNYNAGKNIYS